MLYQIRPYLFFLTLSFPLLGIAAPDWSFCGVPVVTPQSSVLPEQSITEILSDQLLSTNKTFFQFSGNVLLTRGEVTLSADQLQMDKASNLLSANGNLHFSDQMISLTAHSIELDSTNDTNLFEHTRFQLYANHLRGSARKITQHNAHQRDLYDVSYTTCDPGQNTWSLDASKLSLNQHSGRGTAAHAVLRIKDIPVFYFPWFQFPIDDRRMSGLLSPTLTSSDSAGTQLALPFYWNQAENFDMTLTPVWYSKRSTQLNTENRYLFENNAGQLTLSWLDDELMDSERWYRRWVHESDLTDNLHSSILIQKVSDNNFLGDFDHLDTIKEVDYLKSSVTLNSLLANWSLQLLFEQHQIVSDNKTIADSPYKRLPQLSVNRIFSSNNTPLSIDWKNEWVQFDKEEGITGERLHIAPTISYPLEGSYYSIKPALQLDYTRYDLNNNTNDNNSLERSLALFSLDSSLIFERQASVSKNWVQTLEPRLYFLYVPFEKQSDIPLFDSSILAENYNNLFVNNRFSGADRIGDSRQISLGLTTRLLDRTGVEFFSASLGQAFYAQERQVNLNTTIDDRDKSSLMSSVNFKPAPKWDIQLVSAYDQLAQESTQTDISVRRHANDQIFNVEYHLRKDTLEQTTISAVFPISFNWTVFAKQQHSIIHDKPVQNLFGLAYESCCWGFKALLEERSDKDFTDVDRAIFFQLTLKGLSSGGKDINSLLEDGILGFQPLF